MTSLRARLLAVNPLIWVALVYACGVGIRLIYTLSIQPPEAFIYSDMGLYVGLARRIVAHVPMSAPDVTHPLGYAALLSFLMTSTYGLGRAVGVQLVIACLVPLAIGVLGWAAYGRRTGLLAVVFASLYFSFIEYGALFLSEIHFIFWMALAFAGFFGARRARRRSAAVGLALASGFALSVATALKSVALPAAFLFFIVDGIAGLLARPRAGAPAQHWFARLRPWLVRSALVAVAAAPLLGVLAGVCTRANGSFCVTGNKAGADFLMGHYGRVADVEWKTEGHDQFRFGSPGALLRHYDEHAVVRFSITDTAANAAEAWRWIGKHPGEAIVLSLDHIYDTFFGSSAWPTFNSGSWPYANLSQYVFILLLLIPTVLACARVLKRGPRAALSSQTALVMAPIVALAVTVAIATGEVRYRIPFDVFFTVIACAYVVGDLARVEGLTDDD
ncbi:MAG TPA: phospholipid carrier-dependent glycosyltransferase [Polyangia bacterium]|nr:phospholipid carrier-dependent glycosyltransferase [Polyangia bacterium]